MLVVNMTSLDSRWCDVSGMNSNFILLMISDFIEYIMK